MMQSVSTVGDGTKRKEMSPRNLLTTTITDELRMGTIFKVSYRLKDRGAILPAGHFTNWAFLVQ
jgi:hypothetical protein